GASVRQQVVCPSLPRIPNGAVVALDNSLAYGSRVQYRCERSYRLMGGVSISKKKWLTTGSQTLLASNLTNAVAIDFDWTDRRIYWSDVTTVGSHIYSMSFDGSDHKLLHQTPVVHNPDGLAVDWIGRNLYWCDKGTDTIEVSRLDGKHRKVLINSGLTEPRAIVVNPNAGLLYWTDWGETPYIGRVGMDGADVAYVVTENLGWPNALTVDYVTDRLYWGDARGDYLGTADAHGRRRRMLLAHGVHHVFALTLFENDVYWSDWETKMLHAASKTTGREARNVTLMVHRPMDLQILHPLRQPP
ncbi:PREDICTED: prolow-density lipoprotein receptor-related protein 1-like, partial [Priapulus caudatus]|uniref:Prolow-density lipoprotein receptor-related protein 1-like n=1 Tax=Priapulus caudatus TaxID=37621 RepID=A0ABM1F6K9_PRICU